MTPYVWRLCCLSLAVLCLVQVGGGLFLRVMAARIIRWAERLAPSRAASLMLALRWLPGVTGVFVTLCLCVPAYLQLEPSGGVDEELGWLCLALASLALVSYVVPLSRATAGVIKSEIRLRALVRDSEERAGVYVICETSPAMAMAGLFHSRLVVSREVLQLLPADQMDAAQRHERAHQESRDNWKRLVLEMAPVDLSGGALRSAWARFAEWAADDQAGAGDSARSVALASALVSVARLGSSAACLSHASMLVSDGRELRARVERLLDPAGRIPMRVPMGTIACVVAAVALALGIVARQPACAAIIHQVLEALVD